ncbi:MAG: hypothetical protein KF724_00670 [Phycisphaeraceae bacterium]|nr:hypothetical protein [Phycisphaeraceae bacterium]
MRRIIVLLLAVLLGAATTFAFAAYALISAGPAERMSTSIVVRNGTEGWIVRRLDRFGLIWINCERLRPPLVNAAPTLMDIPSWSIPPEGPWPAGGNPRVATLAVGWPAPIAARQWTTTSLSQIFPLQVEQDDGRDSLRRAAGRFIDADGGPPRVFLWRGFLVNTGIFSLAWAIVGWSVAALWTALFHRQERNDEANKDEQR